MLKDPIRIAVLVSGGGTNLQALIDAEKAGTIKDGKLTLVISNKSGVRALSRASEAGIDAMCIPSVGTTQEAFEDKLCEILNEYGIEMIVLAGFMKVLSADFVSKYPNRIINVHPSLIPSFCGDGFYGLKVHEAALEYGVKVTGATVHFVNEVTDGGKIILQKSVAIRKDETPESLQAHVMQNAEWIILPRATQLVCRMIKAEKRGENVNISDIH
ncbi:MAG: phosphoribosylglycinamide formyltransferase [Clostridia bacterium]|nr:phosphoribosylglycinamide formyltransferase [Clostridia bacterium]